MKKKYSFHFFLPIQNPKSINLILSNRSWNNEPTGSVDSCKGQMLAVDVDVCVSQTKKLAVSVLRGPVRNRNRHSSNRKSGVSEESVCVSSRPVGARTRKTGLAGAWLSGRVTRFDYYYCQKRPVPASLFSSFLFFFFSLSSPPLFPRTFFPWHAFTHARHLCTQHAPLPYAVCICTRLFRRYEFECEQRGPVEGGGESSFRSNLPFVDRDWIFSGDARSFGKWILLFMEFSDRFNFFFFFSFVIGV